MTPSERINVISEISRRLSGADWPLIDQTLRQFSLPWSDTWSGDKDVYIIQMIENADDEKLLELAHHVGIEVGRGPVGIDPPFWKDGHLRIFLSHLAEHRAFAGSLKEELDSYGISCFVAHDDIEPTTEWEDQILLALSTCEVLVALLHSGFKSSNWTDQEVGFCMGRGIPSFSIRFDQDPYGFIGRFQAFNGVRKDPDVLAQEIFDKLRTHKQTKRRMAEIIVSRFENSYSFQNAKSNMSLLEDLEVWNPGFSQRIRDAVNSNSQVSGSWGVPGRVETLCKKWES
ncbi:MAG: toll/interleukin-1 receptor domain-containing protein [Candidatus Loosdrechtia sp.]|uniref:toll/interleukin-1 receptor domain-containing protein n=1 Tax=Candidatus Loosdrechtia sp. TaxID=3101272 RepID=UPI003A6BAB2E|nr:MAG: toll/interleukin-1 receptor domain-containing protein [Candidatus Jettenia sp. AMX2]